MTDLVYRFLKNGLKIISEVLCTAPALCIPNILDVMVLEKFI
jgi:hypothetical protein